jgi:AcrR family transcriptional regulator
MDSRPNRVGRQRILEVAEELFTERGYPAVSIRDIARGCAITSAALYYHFPSKDALYAAVLEGHAARLNERMRRAGEAAGSFRQRAAAMLAEFARIAAERRSSFFLFRREGGAAQAGPARVHSREQHAQLMHAMLLPLEDLLRQAAIAGELRKLPEDYSPAALLVGMLHGQVQYRHTCLGEKTGEADVAQVVDIFWDGMENRES